MSDIGVRLSPELRALTRVAVLHHVVHELAGGFGATPQQLEIIRKGIVERKVINEVSFYYLRSGKLVAESSISIDWVTHQASASSGGGTFRLDPSRSIADQVSQVYRALVTHTKKICDELRVTEIKVFFTFVPEITKDSKVYRDTQQFLGTEEKPTPHRDKPYDVEVNWRAKDLKELGVKVQHDKKH